MQLQSIYALMGKLIQITMITSLFVTILSCSAHASKVFDDSLRAELLMMKEREQKLRNMLDSVRGRFGEKSAEMKQLWFAINETDSQNTERFKAIIAVKGFPGKSMVGPDGARAAFLILQHADRDCCIQEELLPVIKEAVEKYEIEGQYLAYLTDRIRVFKKGQWQLYGTQLKQENGVWVPFPIEDKENVDVRRKELGMRPLSDYLELMNPSKR